MRKKPLTPKQMFIQAVKDCNKVKISKVVGIESPKAVEPEQKESYETSAHKADALNVIKAKQRMKICEHARPDGTSIEFFGGRGNLTKAIYQKFTRRNILIEKNKKNFEDALKNLDITRTQVVHQDNLKYLESDFDPQIDYTIVDFDAFGSPLHQMTLFFEKFKVTKPIVIAVTDGFGNNIRRIYRDKDRLNNEMIRYGYPLIERKGMSVSIFMQHITDLVMERFAKKHQFKLEKINNTNNRMFTIYAGYRIMP